MRRPHPLLTMRRLLWAALVVVLAAGVLSVSQPPPPRLAPVADAVTAQIARTGSATFVVEFGDRPNLDPAKAIKDWSERGEFVVDALRHTADRSQQSTLDELSERAAKFDSYWVNNTIVVHGGDGATLSALRAEPEVAKVSAPVTVAMPEPTTAATASTASSAGVTWGVADTGADRVWSDLGVRGEGVVVANIDTGVQFDHPALAASYAGRAADGTVTHDYTWFDPTRVCPAATPCDNNGHGTHTMGTIVGDAGANERIGMAPGARWIAAKGCASTACSSVSLAAAGQWMLAPTDRNGQNADPARRPNLINNSWSGSVNWYQPIVDAWRAAGIIPVFAAGNDGPSCGSVDYPGALEGVIGVGAYAENGTIANFSSRGPSVDGHAKPDIAAPGVAVRSSVPGSAYNSFSGTSMATPHVAGAVALVLSKSPALGFDDVAALFHDTAHDVDDTTCGGTADDNNVWGAGKMDAFAAVQGAPTETAGRLSGVVTDAASGAPVAGVTVAVGARATRTDADGHYSMLVDAGTRELTASGFGYLTTTRTVDIPANTATTVDIGLSATPTQLVGGTITDGGAYGWGIYGRVQVVGQPSTLVHTDPATGRWTARLPEGEHLLSVDSPSYGYGAVERWVTVTAGTAPVNLSLLPGCPAFGYQQAAGCSSLANRGAVVGHVYSTVDGKPIDGATVSIGPGTAYNWERVTTQPTPADPSLDDGFFAVAAAAGAQQLTVTLGGYEPVTVPVTVVKGQVVRADARISAGKIEVGVEGLDRTVAFGEQADGKITLTNNGTANATVKLAERPRLDSSSTATAAVTRVPVELGNGRTDTVLATARPTTAVTAGWETIPDLPNRFGTTEPGVAAVDGIVYAVGGGEAVGSTIVDSNAVFAFDPVTGVWTTKRSMRFGRVSHAVAAIDGRIYTAGGFDIDTAGFVAANDQPRNDNLLSPGLEIYDPVTDTWTQRGGPPTVNQYVAGAALDGQFYLVGGCDVNCQVGSNAVFRYDPAADRWSTVAPYPIKVTDTRCGALAGALYCAGGRDMSTNGAIDRTFRYDPAQNQWREVARLPIGMYQSAGTAANGQLVMSGGIVVIDGEQYVTNETYAYDPVLDTWSTLPPAPRIAFGASGACGLYRIGGFTYDEQRGAFVLGGKSDRLPGMDACGSDRDLPWLSLDRTEVTLAPGESTTVAVRMNSAALAKPGTVRAAVAVVESTPGQVDPIPVTLNVAESSAAGRLAITASGTGRCGAPATPLAGTTVTVTTKAYTRVVRTGTDGTAAVWLLPSEGDATVSMRAPGYQEASRSRLRVKAGQATPVGLAPKQVVPCATVSRETVEATVKQGQKATVDVRIGNDGTAGYDAAVVESPAQLTARPAGRGATVPGASPVNWPATPPSSALPAGWYRTATDYPDTGQSSGVRTVGCDGRTDLLYALDSVRSFTFEPGKGSYAETARYPAELMSGAVAVCDTDKIHVVGGGGPLWNYQLHNAYDTVNRRWTEASLVPGGGRGNASAGIWNGRIFVAGGMSSSSFDARGTVLVYDIATDTWSQLANPMPVPATEAGFAQVGHYLYVVGGRTTGLTTAQWLTTTQRLNMITGVWEVGPDLSSPRTSLNVAATNTALYALGGNEKGPDFMYTRVATVERLPIADWTTGWQAQDPLPRPLVATGAACTESLTGGEIWAIGGLSTEPTGERTVNRSAYFRPVAGERCTTVAGDVPWLSTSKPTVHVDPGRPATVRLTVDTRSLPVGTHHATVLVRTNDPGAPEIRIPVTVTVRNR